MITIFLSPQYIVRDDRVYIDIFDINANANIGQFEMIGQGDNVLVSIKEDEAGYGNIRYRNVTINGVWINSNLLSDGNLVSP